MTQHIRVTRLITGIVAAMMLPAFFGGCAHAQPQTSAAATQPLMSYTPRPLPSNDGRNWGETYYKTERRAKRVVADFEDSIVTVTRTDNGNATVTVTARTTGQLLGQGTAFLSRQSGASLDLNTTDDSSQTPITSPYPVTLDWIAIQSHYDIRDHEVPSSERVWRAGYFKRFDDRQDSDESPLALTTDFGDGLMVATYRRSPNTQVAMQKGTPYFFTEFTRDKKRVGTVQWHPGFQKLVWHFPGITQGAITPETLAQAHGGWTFTPTMAWANGQALIFYETHPSIKANTRSE
jgi:hypothetical protein